MLNAAGGDLLQAPAHATQRHRGLDAVSALALVVGLVPHQQFGRAAGMICDHGSVLQHLHPSGQAAHLHQLANEPKRHAVAATLEVYHAVDADRPVHDDIERVRHGSRQWGQQAALLFPGLGDQRSGHRADQFACSVLETAVCRRL